jgi:hypothetical protein
MRPCTAALFLLVCFLLVCGTYSAAQTQPPPQSARQALIEMFFGTSQNHMEKHLPDATLKTFRRIDSGGNRSLLDQFSMFAVQAKAEGPNFQTFDTGPSLVLIEDSTPEDGTAAGHRVEITVEGDDLRGDLDEIEVALHISENGKEQVLPFVPHFTFAMKSESDVWQLNEIRVSVSVALTDPGFLKNLEEKQRRQNEQRAMWSVQSINTAEKTYSLAKGGFACTLSALGASTAGNTQTFLYDPALAHGRSHGYVFAISGCDTAHYRVAAEPEVTDFSERAFCSDEGGAIRASDDGKATACLSHGEKVQDAPETRGNSEGGVELKQ